LGRRWRASTYTGHRHAAGLYFAYGNADVDIDGLVTNQALLAPSMRGQTPGGLTVADAMRDLPLARRLERAIMANVGPKFPYF
jgi:hypothetical protein